MSYGYFKQKPDEAVYYETVDLNGAPIVVAAERLGDQAQIAFYRGSEWLGGSCPHSWDDAQRIALDQYKTCEETRQGHD